MEKRKIYLETSFLSGVFAIAFGGGMALAHGTKYGVYPFAVYLLLIALGVLLVLSGLRKESGKVKKIPLREVCAIALLFVNPLIGKEIGFYLSSLLSICLISFLFTPPKSAKAALKTVGYCAAASVVVFIVFTKMLRINTPMGILF